MPPFPPGVNPWVPFLVWAVVQLGTAVAVAAAVFKALHEVRSARLNKQADIAAEALYQANRLLEVLSDTAYPYEITKEHSSELAKEYVADLVNEPSLGFGFDDRELTVDEKLALKTRDVARVQSRWLQVEEIAKAFREAQKQAEVYLPPAKTKPLSEIWRAKMDLRYTQESWARQSWSLEPTQAHRVLLENLLHKGWGKVPRTQFDDLRAVAVTALGPIARRER